MIEDDDRKSVSLDAVDLIPSLRAYAWVLTRSRQDVDDLVQETLTKAIANAHRFRAGTNLRAWLITIMRNTFLNQVTKRSRERTGAEDCASHMVSVPGTQEWKVRGNEIVDAIMALPRYYREVLILVVVMGESYQSAAEICGITMGTVKSRVNRARSLVLERLGETRFEDE